MSSNVKKSIFVIEDSKDLRDLIQTVYANEDYQVDFASDGKDALEKLRSRSELPGVILLDLMMPVMDGAKFRAEQEKDARLAAIPVLVMTADSDADIKAKRIGAKGYLRKPVALDIYIKVAEKYCH